MGKPILEKSAYAEDVVVKILEVDHPGFTEHAFEKTGNQTDADGGVHRCDRCGQERDDDGEGVGQLLRHMGANRRRQLGLVHDPGLNPGYNHPRINPIEIKNLVGQHGKNYDNEQPAGDQHKNNGQPKTACSKGFKIYNLPD